MVIKRISCLWRAAQVMSASLPLVREDSLIPPEEELLRCVQQLAISQMFGEELRH